MGSRWLVVCALVSNGCSDSPKQYEDAGIADANADAALDASADARPDAAPGPPVITTFELQGSTTPAPTLAPVVLAHIAATDPDDDVVAFCARIVAGVPAQNDTCWLELADATIAATPAPSVAFDAPVALGYLFGAISVHAWVRDESGRISDAVAPVTITYDALTPPQLIDVRATRTQAPCAPPVAADTSLATTSDDLYIKWHATFPAGSAATPIRLDYTVDGVTYTPIASALANAASAGCSLTPVGSPDATCTTGVDQTAATGCYRWTGTKPTGYFRVRAVATDQRGTPSAVDAVPALNTGAITILAGSTDSGLDGNARDIIFNNEMVALSSLDPKSFAVSSRGIVYFRDRALGLWWVEPTTGTVHRLAPVVRDTQATTGVDGVVGVATVNQPSTIAIDDRDRLWIWDGLHIRRVDVDANRRPAAIVTVIGGGTDLTSSGVPANQVFVGLCNSCSIIPLPNGDVWFHQYQSTANGVPLRVYRASQGVVDAVSVSGMVDLPGTGMVDASTLMVTGLAAVFDPITGTIAHLYVMNFMNVIELSPTGAVQRFVPQPPVQPGSVTTSGGDGRLYLLTPYAVFQLASGGASWQHLVGPPTLPGPASGCSDGMPAQSGCTVIAQDIAVDRFGRLHWLERGRLRSIGRDGAVVSVLGRALGYGDGMPATRVRLARFEQARTWSDAASNRRVVIADPVTYRYREATVGGNLVDIAGTGDYTQPPPPPTPARGQGIYIPYLGSFDLDVATGTLYHPLYFTSTGQSVLRLDRASGDWQHFVGGGTTSYALAPDGTDESQIWLGGNNAFLAYSSVFGIAGGDVLLAFGLYDSAGATYSDFMIKRFPIGTPRLQTHVAGTNGGLGSFCADGTPANACTLTVHPYGVSSSAPVYDTVGARWIMAEAGTYSSTKLRTLPDNPMATVGTLITLPHQFTAFTYARIFPDEWIFYCALDHELYTHRIGDTLFSKLPIPIPGMRCEPATLRYLPSRNSLLFTFSLQGMSGVAEYALP